MDLKFHAARDRVVITASARITAATGVEMEALTAVSMAALTIYDMCKAVDKSMRITNVTGVKTQRNNVHRPASSPFRPRRAGQPTGRAGLAPGSFSELERFALKPLPPRLVPDEGAVSGGPSTEQITKGCHVIDTGGWGGFCATSRQEAVLEIAARELPGLAKLESAEEITHNAILSANLAAVVEKNTGDLPARKTLRRGGMSWVCGGGGAALRRGIAGGLQPVPLTMRAVILCLLIAVAAGAGCVSEKKEAKWEVAADMAGQEKAMQAAKQTQPQQPQADCRAGAGAELSGGMASKE